MEETVSTVAEELFRKLIERGRLIIYGDLTDAERRELEEAFGMGVEDVIEAVEDALSLFCRQEKVYVASDRVSDFIHYDIQAFSCPRHGVYVLEYVLYRGDELDKLVVSVYGSRSELVEALGSAIENVAEYLRMYAGEVEQEDLRKSLLEEAELLESQRPRE